MMTGTYCKVPIEVLTESGLVQDQGFATLAFEEHVLDVVFEDFDKVYASFRGSGFRDLVDWLTGCLHFRISILFTIINIIQN